MPDEVLVPALFGLAVRLPLIKSSTHCGKLTEAPSRSTLTHSCKESACISSISRR